MAVALRNVTAMEAASANNLLNLTFDSLDLELKEYAKEHQVPIIQEEGLAFLESILRLKQPKTILEIGTAIGYSAIRMHKACGARIVTIERNPEMVQLAQKNVKQAKLEHAIEIIEADALACFGQLKDRTFDLIFIDAAKAQYTHFFDLYTPLLSPFGAVICDNMLFHGLVEHQEDALNQSRSLRGLIRKLSSFHSYLLKHPNFDTSIFKIGDGMSISIKRS